MKENVICEAPKILKVGWTGIQNKIAQLAKDKELQSQLRDAHGENRHLFLSEDGMYIYSVGIIDYLQTFNNEKNLEHLYKELRQHNHSMEMSAVPSEVYAKRFFEFMQKSVVKS